MEEEHHKEHRARKAGVKAERKQRRKELKQHGGKEVKKSARENNPKAFSANSVRTAQIALRRKSDLQGKKMHLPKIDHDALASSPPPAVVAVVGPPKVYFSLTFIIFYRLAKQL